MPKIIPYRQASPAMRQAWDRMMRSHEDLGALRTQNRGAEHREHVVDENVAAVDAYRKVCRAEGYVGGNGRTKPPHLERVLPLKNNAVARVKTLADYKRVIERYPDIKPPREHYDEVNGELTSTHGWLFLVLEPGGFVSARPLPPSFYQFTHMELDEFLERMSHDL